MALVAIQLEGEKGCTLADIGCGDQKLRRALDEAGLLVHYSGFDLLPQGPDVTALDIEAERLPQAFDIGVLLGVLEYCGDPKAVLDRLRGWLGALVVSHAASDLSILNDRRKKRLMWKSQLTTGEFEEILGNAGFGALERRITPDGRTAVWRCQ